MGKTTKVPKEKPLSIRLLGPPEASLWGRGIRFGTKKALALLCYLAAAGAMRDVLVASKPLALLS
jgi:hypothetical protein